MKQNKAKAKQNRAARNEAEQNEADESEAKRSNAKRNEATRSKKVGLALRSSSATFATRQLTTASPQKSGTSRSMSNQVYKNTFFQNFFALVKKNVKEQRARAHVAFVVEVFFSEFVLPLEWETELKKNLFQGYINKT